MTDRPVIAVIGLGYVGLPLSVEFSFFFKVIGFDINQKRVDQIKSLRDTTHEADLNALKSTLVKGDDFLTGKNGLICTSDDASLKNAQVYIITVPTPVDEFKKPDTSYLTHASALVGRGLKKNDVVIYESTVYPGCTEEVCIPVLEKSSGLVYNKDFFVGYSPERINPGDDKHPLPTIMKVTSGSTPEVARYVDNLYKTIITAGTYLAPSIKVAEASKAIENAQRDLNISFVNELSLIFDRLGIDTYDVLEAASTKWNFLNFSPGLVGGHCINVDPYYLTYKAESVGYHPSVILSGRRVNDAMSVFVANKVIKLMIQKEHKIKGAKVALLGITFKENCPDIRNSKAVEVCTELQNFGLEVDVIDPIADTEAVEQEYKMNVLKEIKADSGYKAIILCVPHEAFLTIDFASYKTKHQTIIFDVKGVLDRSVIDARL